MLMVTKCPGAVYFFGCFPSLQLKIFHLKCIEENLKRRIWKINWNLSKGFKVVPIQNSTLEHLQILTFNTWVLSPDTFYRWDHLKGERSQTQTHLLVLPQCTNCVWSAILREDRAGLKLESNIFCSSRPAQDPPDEHLYYCFMRTKPRLEAKIGQPKVRPPCWSNCFAWHTADRHALLIHTQNTRTTDFFIPTRPERFAWLGLTRETCFSNGSSAAIKVLISVIIVCLAALCRGIYLIWA